MNKYSIAALFIAPIVVIAILVGTVLVGIAIGTSQVLNGAQNTSTCAADESFFGDFDKLREFIDSGGCQQACSVSAGEEAESGTYAENQVTNVRKIIGVGQKMAISDKGMIIAIATALVESNLQNYANDGIYDTSKNPADSTLAGNPDIFNFAKTSLTYPHDAVGSDATSVGLFQQQAWWGTIGASSWQTDPTNTMKRLMDPSYGAQKFYDRMLKVNGWENMEPGTVAQKVQVSAFPDAYATRLTEASQLLNTYKGSATQPASLYDLGGNPAPGTSPNAPGATLCGTGVLPLDKNALYQVTAPFAEKRGNGAATAGSGGTHGGVDFDCNNEYENVYSMVAGTVTLAVNGNASGYGNPMGQVNVKTPDGIVFEHMHGRNTKVAVGDLVSPGQNIMECASTGPSTGTHLHLTANVSEATREDVKALPLDATRPNLRDPAQVMKLLGVDICPPYTTDREGKTPGAPLPTALMKCWPKEEWVR